METSQAIAEMVIVSGSKIKRPSKKYLTIYPETFFLFRLSIV
jgi:hypothetical protein